MPSGKQLSFQYGEVSPSLRFRSDAVSYSAGLSKLKNMYVRKAGGVSNRPGTTIRSEELSSPNLLPLENESMRIKSFFHKQLGTITCVLTINGNRLYLNGGELFYKGATISAPDPATIRFTSCREGIVITPESFFSGVIPAVDPSIILVKLDGSVDIFKKNDVLAPTAAATLTRGYSGTAPFLPVSYYVTATLKDNSEVLVSSAVESQVASSSWPANPTTAPGGVTIFYPHSNLNSWVRITFGAADQNLLNGIRFFNFYRASGSGASAKSFYQLAGRVPYDGSLTVQFTDYGGSASALTPPIDDSMFGLVNANFIGMSCAAYYQQRLIFAVSNYAASSSLKKGDLVATALGPSYIFR
jgi:hypothetical protein